MVEAAAWEPRGVYPLAARACGRRTSDIGLRTSDFGLRTSDFATVDMSVYFRKCAAKQLVTGYPTQKVRVTCILYCK